MNNHEHDPSRRNFIKASIIAAAGTVVLGGGIAKINSKNKTKGNREQYNPERLDDLPNKAFGIDISYANELDIDKFYKEVQLTKDKEEKLPVNIAYIRIGRGTKPDNTFDQKWTTIHQYNQDKNIPNKFKVATGVYFYYRYHKDPNEQWKAFKTWINDNNGGDLGQLIPMLDVEQIENIKPPKTLKKDVQTFLNRIENEFGVKPGIYSGLSFFQDYLDGGKPNGQFNEYKHRIANYKDNSNEIKENIKNNLGYTPALIQWSKSLPLPGTGNSDEHTDGNDTENLSELFIKNNMIGDKYNPQGEENNEGNNENNEDNNKDNNDTLNTGVGGGKLGGIIGGLSAATLTLLHQSRDKNKTDRRDFIKKIIKIIIATIAGALAGALVGSQIEKYNSLDMKFDGRIEDGYYTQCIINLDEKEIILFRNILNGEAKGMKVQRSGEISQIMNINNREKIEDFIAKEFDGFSFSNRDRRKIIKNMDLIPNEENAAPIAMSDIFDVDEMPYTAKDYNTGDDWKTQQDAMNDAQDPLIDVTKRTNIKEYEDKDDIVRFTTEKEGRLEKVEDTGNHYFIRKNQIHKDRRVLSPKALKNMKELFERANKYLRKDFGLKRKYHIKYPIHSLTRDRVYNENQSGSKDSTHISGLAVDITTVNHTLPKLYEGNSEINISDDNTREFKQIAHAALYKAASEMKDKGKIIPNIESDHLHVMLYTGVE